MSTAKPRKRHPVLRSLAAVGAAAVLLVASLYPTVAQPATGSLTVPSSSRSSGE